MKPKIYLDSSVFGGYFDDEFEKESKILFSKIEAYKFEVLISDILETEIESAPYHVKQLLDDNVPKQCRINIASNEKVKNLAQEYIKANVISERHLNDTLHIACATVFNASVLISWNFKHIVNYNKIKGYDQVNSNNGYNPIKILSPKSFMY